MNIIKCLALFCILIVFGIACTNPSSTTTASGGGSTELINAINQIQIGSMTLPKSLQASATNVSRAFGDISVLSSQNLASSLKSQDYINFMAAIKTQTAVQQILSAIQSSTVIKHNTLRMDGITDLGTMIVGQKTLTGKIKASTSTDGAEIYVYCSLNVPTQGKVPLYLIINNSGIDQLYLGGGMNSWSQYDTNTKSSVIASSINGSKQLTIIQPQPDGSFLAFFGYSDPNGTRNEYCYGNSSFAGIIVNWSTLASTTKYIDYEYYNDSASLVLQGGGDDTGSEWAIFQPESMTYLGHTYSVMNNFTLTSLLPLAPQYSNYVITAQEQQTLYMWIDTNGVQHPAPGQAPTVTTAPAQGTYQPNTLTSETGYVYWLENTSDSSNDPKTFNATKGDISISLNNNDIWVNDPVTGVGTNIQYPAFFTGQTTTVPSCFTLNQSYMASASMAKGALENHFSDPATLTVDWYMSQANFDATLASVSSQMP